MTSTAPPAPRSRRAARGAATAPPAGATLSGHATPDSTLTPRADVRLPVGRQIVAALLLTGAAAITALYLPPLIAGAVMIVAAVLYLARRAIFSWPGAMAILVGVVMFVPVRRYALPIPLPFALELYRVVLLALSLAILGALLLWKRPWQPVAFGWPIGIFFASLVISIPMNGTALVEASLASTSIGALLNYVILLSAFYITRQLLTSESFVLGLLTGLVWCGAALGALAMFERVTRYNVFAHLHVILPFDVIAEDGEAFRAGGYRSFASSQHPIALSVMFCILIPLAIYLSTYSPWPRNPVNRRIVYSLATVLMLAGVLAAVSRTAVVVLAVMVLVTLLLRPWLGITLIALALPALLVGLAVLPKVFNTLVLSFFDLDGLVASQQTSPGWRGAGRLADLGPAYAEFVQSPFFGTGVGSRIVIGETQNAFILDNQVLGTMLETGTVGLIGLICLIIVPLIMLLRFAFTAARDAPQYAMLAFALAVSGAGFSGALFFYDAFGFYQAMFVYFMLLAVGAWLLTASSPARAARATKTISMRERQGVAL
jgi:polysaccharide biosynthesis protein PslJ